MSNYFTGSFGIDLSPISKAVSRANTDLSKLGTGLSIGAQNVTSYFKSINEKTGALTMSITGLTSSFQKLQFTEVNGQTKSMSIQSNLMRSVKELNALYGEQNRLRTELVQKETGAIKSGPGPIADRMNREADIIRARLIDIKTDMASYDQVARDLSKFGTSGRADTDFMRKQAYAIDMATTQRNLEIEAKQVDSVNKLYAERGALFTKLESAESKMTGAGANTRRVLSYDMEVYRKQLKSVDEQLARFPKHIVDQADKTQMVTQEEEARRQAAYRTAAAYDQQAAQLDRVATRITQIVVMLGARIAYQGIKEAVEYAADYHNILNEIQVVTLKTKEETDALGVVFRRMGKELKTPSSEIAGSAVEWYRQGLNDTQVRQRLTEATKLSRVAAISIEESTRLITTAINSGMVETAERATDVLVALGDAAATNAEEIGQAMQRSAASAQAAGVSYEWLATYITIISERTRLSADVIGTTMRSMFARLQQIKESGFNSEDSTDINMIEKAFANINRELGTNMTLLEEDRKTWRSLPEVFNEIAANWGKMNDKQRSYLMTQLAGVRQQDKMLALMFGLAESFEDTTRGAYLYNIAVESAGTTNDKFAIALESVSSAQSNLRASLEELYTTIISGDTIKKFYDDMAGLVDIFSKGIEAVGGFDAQAVILIATVITATAVIFKLGSAIGGVITALAAKTTAMAVTGVFASLSAALPAITIAIAGITAAIVYFAGKARDAANPVGDLASEIENLESSRSEWDTRITALEEYKGKLYDLSLSTADTATKQEQYNLLMQELLINYPSLAAVLQDTAGGWVGISSAISAVIDKMGEYAKIRDAEAVVNANRVALSAANEMAPILNEASLIKRAYNTFLARYYANQGMDDEWALLTDPSRPDRGETYPAEDVKAKLGKLAPQLGYGENPFVVDLLGHQTDMITKEYTKWIDANWPRIGPILDTLYNLELKSAQLKIGEFNRSLITMLTAQEGFSDLPEFAKEKLLKEAEGILANIPQEELLGMSSPDLQALLIDKYTEMSEKTKTITDNLPSLAGQFVAGIWARKQGWAEGAPGMDTLSSDLTNAFGTQIIDAQKSMEDLLTDADISKFWGDFVDRWFGPSMDVGEMSDTLSSFNSPFEVMRYGVSEKIEELSSRFTTDGEKLQLALDRLTSIQPDQSGSGLKALKEFYGFLSGDRISEVRFNEFINRLSIPGSDISEIGGQVWSWISLPSGSGVGAGEGGAEKVLSVSEAYAKLNLSANEAAIAMQHAQEIVNTLAGADTTGKIQDAAKSVEDYFMKIPEQYHKTIGSMLPGLDALIENMRANATTVGDIQATVGGYRENMFAVRLGELEKMGVAYDGISDILLKLGTQDAPLAEESIYQITHTSLPALMKAMAGFNMLYSGAGSPEEVAKAYQDIASVIGVSADAVKADLDGAYDAIQLKTGSLMNTITAIGREMDAVYPNFFSDDMRHNSDAMLIKLRELASAGNEYAKVLVELIDGMGLYGNAVVSFNRDAENQLVFTQESAFDTMSFEQLYARYNQEKPETRELISRNIAQRLLKDLGSAEDDGALIKIANNFKALTMSMGEARVAVFDLLPGLGELLNGIENGTITLNNIDKAIVRTGTTLSIDFFKGMEDTGRGLSGMSAALEAYRVSSTKGTEAMKTMAVDAGKLSLALYSLKGIEEGSIASAEKQEEAYKAIADVTGMTAEQVAANRSKAGAKLVQVQNATFTTMRELMLRFTNEERALMSGDNWREALSEREVQLSSYARAFLELQRGFEETPGVKIKVVDDGTNLIKFITEATVSITALQDTFARLQENAGFTEDDTAAAAGGIFSNLFGATTTEELQSAATDIELMWNSMEGAQADALAKMLPGFDNYIKRIKSGEITLSNLKNESKAYSDILLRYQIRSQEAAGRSLEGVSDIMDDFAENNVERANRNLRRLAMTTMPQLMRGLNSMKRITLEGPKLSAEEMAAAWEDVAAAIGLTAEQAIADPVNAFALLADQASITTTTLNSLGYGLRTVAGTSFSADNWESELSALAASGDTTAAIVWALIQTMKQVDGAEIKATPTGDGGLQFNLEGLGVSPGTTPKSKGRGGGGGGGSSSGQVSEVTNNFIEALERRKKIDDFALSLLALKKAYYEVRGETTAAIEIVRLEIKRREQIDKANKKELESINARIEAKEREMRGLKAGSDAYKNAKADLEALREKQQEYTLAVQDNINAIEELKKSIEEMKDSIRDQEIDLRNTIEQAFRDREEKERGMLDARADIENQILDIIRKRHEEEWKLIQEDINKQRDAYNEEIQMLRDNLNERKKAAEEADKYEELASLEQQLAMIAADPTRAKERLNLEKKIADIREELSWQAAEDEVNAQVETIQGNIDSLDEYQEYMQKYYEDLFANPQAFIEELTEVMSGSTADILKWLQTNSDEFINATKTSQTIMTNEWSDTLLTMEGKVKTYWKEVEALIKKGDKAIIAFLKENSADYAAAGKLQAQAYVDEWTDKLEKLRAARKALDEEIKLPATPSTPSGTAATGTTASKYRVTYEIFNANGEKVNSGSGVGGTPTSARRIAESYAALKLTQPDYYAVYSDAKPYKRGGLVDKTGIAIVHGTTTDPEAFLSATDTRNMRFFMDALDKVFVPFMGGGILGRTTGTTNTNSITIENFTIQLERLETDQDFELLGEKVADYLGRAIGVTAGTPVSWGNT